MEDNMKRNLSLLAALCLGLFGHGRIDAQDLMLQARPGEAPLGPIPSSQVVQGVSIGLRTSLFFSRRDDGGTSTLVTRLLVDLSDVQAKIGDLVNTLPLPREDCAHFGADNLVLGFAEKALDVRGNQAILRLKGSAEVWACMRALFGGGLWKTKVEQPAEIELPFQLTVAGQRTVAIQMGTPTVHLDGPLEPAMTIALQFLKIDLGALLKKEIDREVNLDLLKWSLPEVLLRASPELRQAEFVSNSGALVAAFQVEALSDGDRGLSLVLPSSFRR
jgi:hypothetical protein